jgi:RNA polymerase sigma factor (sigma-70 family)
MPTQVIDRRFKPKQRQSLPARNALVVRWMPLIYHVIGRMTQAGFPVDKEEFFQEGAIALIHAAEHYVEDGRACFKTYAMACIYRRLQRRANEGTVIRTPSYLVTTSEDCRPRGMERTFDRLLDKLHKARHPMPLPDDYDMAIAEEEESVDFGLLDAALEKLPPREKFVLRAYYGPEEPTFESLAVVLRVSRERVRQLRNRALKRLRSRLGNKREHMAS